MKNKAELLKKIAELLDDPHVVIRIQREMTPEQNAAPDHNNYVLGKRVTIILVGTTK